MTIYSFVTSNDADNVYLYGTKRLTARDGYAGVGADYYVPVEQYANKTYNMIVMDDALSKGWINQQEYNETLAYGVMPATAPAATTTPPLA